MGRKEEFYFFEKNNFSFSLFFFFEFLGLRGCMGVGVSIDTPMSTHMPIPQKRFEFPTPFSPPYDETKKAAGVTCGKNE